jgi:hypothetical protein
MFSDRLLQNCQQAFAIRHSQITSNYLAILDRQIAIAYLAIKERKIAESIKKIISSRSPVIISDIKTPNG